MFTDANGDRTPHNPNTMVLITDGQSGNPIPAANAAKAAGIKIIAVGVGSNVNMAHLNGIVTDSSTDIYNTNNFCDISTYLKKRFNCDQYQARPTIARRCTKFAKSDADDDESELSIKTS